MTQNEGGGAPLVSVITPCYNAAEYVGETLEAVLAQSNPAIEHIVVDDGSTDGSWEVVQRYAERHPERIRGQRLEGNRGGSHARNRGAELSRGEFLMFLDADDLITPETLERLVEALRAEEGAIAVCGWKRLRQEEGRWVSAPGEVPLPDAGANHLQRWLEGQWVPPCSVLWRRDVYERTGGWDESLSLNDDGDLMMRALARGGRLVRAHGGTSLYRTHGSTRVSVSQSFLAEGKLRSQMRVFQKLEAELEEQGRLADFAASLSVAFHRTALVGYQNGHRELAKECERRGEALGGRRAVSRTRVGRLMVRLLGMERKERILAALARVGIMTSRRRAALQLRRAAAARDGVGR